MRCENCRTKFTVTRFLQKHCESPECKIAEKKYQEEKRSGKMVKTPKAIPKFSDKRKVLNPLYAKVRIEVLVEAKFKCFIDGCTNVANTCEHTMGRKGFADQWARDNDIPLLIDKRYLKACCFHHNGELENNPELSKEYQLSKIHGGRKL
jgi:hypothetical protein